MSLKYRRGWPEVSDAEAGLIADHEEVLDSAYPRANYSTRRERRERLGLHGVGIVSIFEGQ